jgi:hypothetical protein
MTKLAKGSAVLLMVFSAGGCAPTNVVPSAQIYNPVDSVQEYTQRSDTITLSAGNAQDVNTRVQEIDPWPRYVGNKRIAANGERMAGAVERYRDVAKQRQAPQTLPLGSAKGMSSGGGGGVGSAGSAGSVGAGAAGQ